MITVYCKYRYYFAIFSKQTYLAEIKSELSDIRNSLAINTQMLQSLSAGPMCEVTGEDMGITLPLQNSEELDEIEQQLLHDPKFKKSLVSMT